ncbi:MAG TPA: hypothetical protein VII45_00345 [Solirubrobacterales bacterium]
MSKRLIATLAGVLTIALIVAGCGSSSDSSTDSTASLTKAEFVKQGNAICAAGNKQIETGIESFAKQNHLSESKPPTEAQAAEIAETVLVPSVSGQLEEIEALGVPRGEEDQVDAIFAAVEGAIEKAEEDPSVLLSEKGASAFTKANQLSREYGLTVCGEEN